VKVAGIEGRVNEAAAKLSAASKEKKELEARHLKELDDLVAKQKLESERRDTVRAQEVQRLQQAVQEKSKALKVVELELARYKTKGAAAPSAARSAAPAAAKPTVADVPAADAAAHPPRPATPAAAAARPAARPAPAAVAAKVPVANPAPPRKAPPPALGDADSGDRTVVMEIPVEPAPEDDWTALVDELDK
jgi:hypothetical protein